MLIDTYLCCLLRFILHIAISRLDFRSWLSMPFPSTTTAVFWDSPWLPFDALLPFSSPIAAWALFSPGHTVDNAQWPALHMPQLVQLSWRASGGQRQPYIQHSPRRIELHGRVEKGWHVKTCYDIFQLIKYDCSMTYAAGARDLQQWGLCHSRHAPETAAELVPHLQLFPPFAPRSPNDWRERERESKYLNVRKPACATCFEQTWNDMRQNMAEFT